MDWDDIFDDDRFDNDQKHNTYKLLVEQLELEQPIISKKDHLNAYSVERTYINSKEYHDKFERIPVNRDVQQRLYLEAGRLLNFVDGREEEHLLAINARTGKLLVDNFNRTGSIKGTGFTDEEAKCLEACSDGIILLHNHSLNGRPSIQDMLTYLSEDQIKISLIMCHDGTIYGIYKVSSKLPDFYSDLLEHTKSKTEDLDEAKRLATTQIYLLNDVLSNRHKLFIFEKI